MFTQIKIWWYKKQLKKWYLIKKGHEDRNDCGLNMLRATSAEYCRAEIEVEHYKTLLKKLDKNFPK